MLRDGSAAPSLASACYAPFVQDIAANARAILESAPIELAVLFGSAARGTARPDSDVDIGIVPTRTMTLRERLDLGVALERALSCEVDLVILDANSSTLLRLEAAKGRPLLERTPGAFADFVSRALFAHDDVRPHLHRAVRATLRDEAGA